MTGVLHLTRAEAAELHETLLAFFAAHDRPREGRCPTNTRWSPMRRGERNEARPGAGRHWAGRPCPHSGAGDEPAGAGKD